MQTQFFFLLNNPTRKISHGYTRKAATLNRGGNYCAITATAHLADGVYIERSGCAVLIEQSAHDWSIHTVERMNIYVFDSSNMRLGGIDLRLPFANRRLVTFGPAEDCLLVSRSILGKLWK